jgi:acyl carrier protein
MNYAEETRDFVVSNFLFGEAGSLQDDTSFMRSGIIDSTGILELVAFIEATYHVKIENQEMIPANLDSLHNVARFLERKLGSMAGETTPSI